MNKTLLLLSSLTVHCSYRLKFFAAKDHLWDGNSHNCSLLGFVPLKAPEGQVHRGCGTAHRNAEIDTESCMRVGPALFITKLTMTYAVVGGGAVVGEGVVV